MKIYLVLLVLLLTSCADTQTVDACMTGHTYGFFAGVWHGFIIGFSMLGSLFDDSIAIYAVNNNGAFYNLGFFIGTGLNLRMLFPKKKSE